MYKSFFKPLIDFTLSLIALVFLSPLFILIVFLLVILNNGKPFFIQKRPGYKTKTIKILKFKTMNEKKDNKGKLLPPAQRITVIGKFLRKTSLDEIPQLLNVIRGDLSLVGPRPLRIEYLPHYTEDQIKRHDVKPGITGWAQINGRNALTWEQKFDYDLWYTRNISFLLDLKIIYATIIKVLKQDDINLNQNTISQPFKGIKLDG